MFRVLLLKQTITNNYRAQGLKACGCAVKATKQKDNNMADMVLVFVQYGHVARCDTYRCSVDDPLSDMSNES